MNRRKRLLLFDGLLRDGADKAPGVGVAALVEDFLSSTELDGTAGVHNHDLIGHIGDDAQVMGNHDDGVAVLLLHFLHKLNNLSLNGNVQGSRGLVGNQNIGIAGKGHGNHDALTHTARELMWILIDALLGLGNANKVQKLGGALERLLLGVTTVQTKTLAHLLADLIDRVQGGHRILEDHRDIVTANVLHLFLSHFEDRTTAIANVAALDLSRRHRDKTHDGHGGHGLTGAGLTDDAKGFAAIERVGHTVDSANDAILGMEIHLKVIDLEQMLALGNRLVLQVHIVLVLLHPYASFILTSRASRRPSPSRVKASTVERIARPGMIIIQGAVRRYC